MKELKHFTTGVKFSFHVSPKHKLPVVLLISTFLSVLSCWCFRHTEAFVCILTFPHCHKAAQGKRKKERLEGGYQAAPGDSPAICLALPRLSPCLLPCDPPFTFQADVTVLLLMGHNNSMCNRCSSLPPAHGRQESFTHFHLASGKLSPL